MKRLFVVLTVLIVLFSFTGCLSLGKAQSGEDYMEDVDAKGNYGSWRKAYYLNDFKKSTGVPYIKTVCDGTYTDDSVKDASLKATVMCDRDDVKIELLEDGEKLLSLENGKRASITVKILADNKEIGLGAGTYDSKTRYISLSSSLNLFEALVENRVVLMHITIEDGGETSTYLFKIFGYGFEYCYRQTFK